MRATTTKAPPPLSNEPGKEEEEARGAGDAVVVPRGALGPGIQSLCRRSAGGGTAPLPAHPSRAATRRQPGLPRLCR